ncbi:hypothetical protein DICVIV_12318 [Dictyocaulus viviparus]|uniref:Uncharacterized protein n=1 Tax=Dictyocaulus viviparus TaxID=29172 RepID=A0A0D8XD74_DICVI|nr:hypothetical protein DICVIV_12318 [Dictyocaulus viviparus]
MPPPKVYTVTKLQNMTIPPIPSDGRIALPVIHKDALLFWYKADAHAPFKDLMILSQLYTGIDYCAITFICNRYPIAEHQSPAQLGLHHGDPVMLRFDGRFRKNPAVEFSPAIKK